MYAIFRVDKVSHNKRLARTVAWFVHRCEADDYVLIMAGDPLNTKFDYRVIVEDQRG